MLRSLLCLTLLLVPRFAGASSRTFVSCSDASCYSFVQRQQQRQRPDFNKESADCRRAGGHLAALETRDEAQLLGKLLRAIDEEISRSSTISTSSSSSPRSAAKAAEYWMGLRRNGCRMDMSGPLRGFSWPLPGRSDWSATGAYANWMDNSFNSCTRDVCVSLVPAPGVEPPDWRSRACKSQAVHGSVCEHPVGVSVASGCGPLMPEEAAGAVSSVRYYAPWDDSGAVIPLEVLPLGSKAVIVCGDDAGGDDGAQMSNALCSSDSDGVAFWRVSASLPCVVQPLTTKLSSSAAFPPTCQPGFEPAPGGKCAAVDRCTPDPCQQPGLCTNTKSGFECDCVEGYQLVNRTRCVDIDECEYEPCDHDCLNTDGSYECSCPAGYRQDRSAIDCEDIDECAEGAHACRQLCNNTEGAHECSCLQGWRLLGDNATCESTASTAASTASTTTATATASSSPTAWPPTLAFHELLPLAVAMVLLVMVVCGVAMVMLCCRGAARRRRRRREQEEEEEEQQGGKNEYVWLSAPQAAGQGVKEAPRPSAPSQVQAAEDEEGVAHRAPSVDETRLSNA